MTLPCALLAVRLALVIPVSGDAPPWAASIPPGTWAAVGTNTIADLNPRHDPDLNPSFPDSPPWNGNTGLAAIMSAQTLPRCSGDDDALVPVLLGAAMWTFRFTDGGGPSKRHCGR